MFDTGAVRIAGVGYGYCGSTHVRLLSGRSEVLVLVVDECEERKQAATIQHRGTGVASCLADALDDVGAVTVATPSVPHKKLALAALRARKHVPVEKPQATSSADAGHMVAEAMDADVVRMTGYTSDGESSPSIRPA